MAWLVDDDALGSYQAIAGLFLQLQVLPGLLVKPHLPALMRLSERSLIHHAARRLLLGGLLTVPATLLVLIVLGRSSRSSRIPASCWQALFPWSRRVPMWCSFPGARSGTGAAPDGPVLPGRRDPGRHHPGAGPFLGIAGGLWGTACAQWTILAGAWRFLMKRPPLWSADRQP